MAIMTAAALFQVIVGFVIRHGRRGHPVACGVVIRLLLKNLHIMILKMVGYKFILSAGFLGREALLLGDAM
jgi:hypothetical protein